MEILLKGLQCLRCGHQWKPRKSTMPAKCPGCDSPHWQFPRGEGLPPHLEEAFRLYEVPADQRADIIRYAYQHPGVGQALVEAVPEMEKVFGKTRRRLDLYRFWDSDDEEIFGRILLKEYTENSFELMDRFLQAWAPRIPKEARTCVSVKVNREDDYPSI